MNLFAIYVTYNPDITLLKSSIQTVQKNCPKIILVDNASSQNLQEIFANDKTIKIIQFTENKGIGMALNAGIKFAKENGATHTLLFDQDSQPDDKMIEVLISSLDSLTKTNDKIAAVGPKIILCQEKDVTIPFKRFHGYWRKSIKGQAENNIEADYLITSGTLISLESFSAIGPFNEEFFIDYVDVEWGLRAKNLGYSCFGISKAKLYHNLGEKQAAGSDSPFFAHSPERYFYICRNPFLMAKMKSIPFHTKPFFIILTLLRPFYYISKPLPEKIECLKKMVSGIYSGILQTPIEG